MNPLFKERLNNKQKELGVMVQDVGSVPEKVTLYNIGNDIK